jgi:acyl transferase domain-containing protein
MKTAVVVCPGRGTYSKSELGYLARRHPDRAALFAGFDRHRIAQGQKTLTDLDGAETYSLSVHTRGDNASALIYAATLADFLSISRDEFDVVAVTGNSMGWYSALACAGAVTADAGFIIANTMGALMQQSLIGGQLVYPHMGQDWVPAPAVKQELLTLAASIDARDGHVLALSIDLGGMLVLAGNEAGLDAFTAAVPPVQDRFPLRLANHAAFHTNLQAPVAERGRTLLGPELFGTPSIPLIDGRGDIWWPHATDSGTLRDYTLGDQVTTTYDFTRAITVAAREFAPDVFIVTGPGTTLNSAVIQSLILANWRGLDGKSGFLAMQKALPVLTSMGSEE